MDFRLQELRPGFVAEVNGIDLTHPIDAETSRSLRNAIARSGALVFRGQDIDDEQQVALANCFGAPRNAAALDDKLNKRRRLSLPQMVDVSNLDEANRLREASDRRRMLGLANQLWHTDSSFEAVRGGYSLLSARAVPAEGGETEIADLRSAFDDLPATMKARIDGLAAQHSLLHSRSLLGFDGFSSGERSALVSVPWPVAEMHVPSGRKTLYLASHASHIVGWPVPEGRMLLLRLIEFATQRHYVYTHTWQKGDLLIWDNRCTMHRGRPFDETAIRDLRRVTTDDEYALAKTA